MNNPEDIKQVIVWQNGLKGLPKGKFAAQCCHASMAALMKAAHATTIGPDDCGHPECLAYLFDVNGYAAKWIRGIFTKIVLQVPSEEELLIEYNKIVEYNENSVLRLPVALITDSGLTVFNGVPTITCFGVGPGPVELINQFTGHLKLL